MKDIPAGQAEVAFEIEGRQDFAGEDALLEIRGVPVDRFDDHISRGFPLLVPAAAAGQRRVEVLAEEARHVHSGRGEPRVDGARDQHLRDGLAREAGGPGVEISALHVGERRRDDDAGTVVRLRVFSGGAGKIG